jgi:hypothetical protein
MLLWSMQLALATVGFLLLFAALVMLLAIVAAVTGVCSWLSLP